MTDEIKNDSIIEKLLSITPDFKWFTETRGRTTYVCFALTRNQRVEYEKQYAQLNMLGKID